MAELFNRLLCAALGAGGAALLIAIHSKPARRGGDQATRVERLASLSGGCAPCAAGGAGFARGLAGGLRPDERSAGGRARGGDPQQPPRSWLDW